MKLTKFLGWFFDIVFAALIVLAFIKSDFVSAVFLLLLTLKSYATTLDLIKAQKQLAEYRGLTEILIGRVNHFERKSNITKKTYQSFP